MRNDFTPIETCEIDDAELDNVSGGVMGFDPASMFNPFATLPTDSFPAPVSGAVHQVTGTIPGSIPGA